MHVAGPSGPTLAAPKAAKAAPPAKPKAPMPTPRGASDLPGPALPTGAIKDARLVPGLDTPPAHDAPARRGSPSRILFVGDSHTPKIATATGDAAKGQLRGSDSVFQIGTQLRRWFVQPHYGNDKNSQETRAATITRNEKLVKALQTHPQEVVVSLGTNDGGDYAKIDGHESKATLQMIAANDSIIRRNVREMVGLVRSNGAQLTWALPLNTRDQHNGVDRAREVIRSELSTIQREIDTDTQARGAPAYRINVVDISRTPIPMANGLHANDDGYATWGASVWKSYQP